MTIPSFAPLKSTRQGICPPLYLASTSALPSESHLKVTKSNAEKVMDDSTQSSTSQRDQKEFESDIELGDKQASGTSNSPDLGSVGEADTPAEGGTSPIKRTRLETVVLMATLCVSLSRSATRACHLRLTDLYFGDSCISCRPRHHNSLHSATNDFRPLPINIRFHLDWLGFPPGGCCCATELGEI